MSMTELEKRCVDALAKAQGLDPHEIAALPISTATGNLLDEVRAVLAEAGVAELEAAGKLALEYWAHRQMRYKNRSPVWVQDMRAALTKIGANQ